jgi:hypothetical protein
LRERERAVDTRPFAFWRWGPPNSMLCSYPRFHNFGSASTRSRSWSIFHHFGRENSAVMPNSCVLLFTITTASPRRNKTKIQKGRDPNIKNACETIFLAGDETLGGKEILIERERERAVDTRPFAFWLETTRTADAPGTRKLVFPVLRLHVASPTGPGPSGSEPI